MTKLQDILNNYYVTEPETTVTDHIKAICSEVDKDDMDAELQSLFAHLNKVVE